MITWIMRWPLTQRNPLLSGMLCSLGLLVGFVISAPPVFWALNKVFGWAIRPVVHVLALWWLFWQ